MRNLLFKGILLITFLFSKNLLAQQNSGERYPQPFLDGLQFTAVTLDEATPKWAYLLYSENPNFFQIEKLYKSWRKNNPDTKNGHTRNFKHYFNYLNQIDGLDIDGYVRPSNEERIYNEKNNWLRERKIILKEQADQVRSRSASLTDWESLGPIMMYQNGSPANIQANIYSICQSASNNNIVYAVSEAGGTVFKSIDKGDNWSSTTDDLHFSGPREIEVDPTDPDILYLGSQHDINKSLDGGPAVVMI